MMFLMIFWLLLPAVLFVLFFLFIQKVNHPIAHKINQGADAILEWRRHHGSPLPELILISAVAAGFFLAARMIQGESVWNEGELHLYWNAETADTFESVFQKQFGTIVRTPQSEPIYFLKSHLLQEAVTPFPYRFVVIFLNPDEWGLLPEAIGTKRASWASEPIQVLKHVYARNQWIFVIDTALLNSLPDSIEPIDEMCRKIQGLMDQRISEGLFVHADIKKRQKNMLEKFGWTFQTLADFEVRIDDSARNFVSLSPKTGNRWIHVRWIDGAAGSMMTPGWIVAQRNRLGELYYHGTQVESRHLIHHEGEFLNSPALIVRGLWGHEERVIGGPFKSVAFYDSLLKRIYLIDYAVHASGMRKMPMLRRMEIVTRSFQTHHSLLLSKR